MNYNYESRLNTLEDELIRVRRELSAVQRELEMLKKLIREWASLERRCYNDDKTLITYEQRAAARKALADAAYDGEDGA